MAPTPNSNPPNSGSTSILNAHQKHKGKRGEPGFEGPEQYTPAEVADMLSGSNPFRVGDKVTFDSTFRRNGAEITPEIVAAEGLQNAVQWKARVNGKERDISMPGTSAGQTSAGFDTHIELDEAGDWEVQPTLLGFAGETLRFRVK